MKLLRSSSSFIFLLGVLSLSLSCSSVKKGDNKDSRTEQTDEDAEKKEEQENARNALNCDESLYDNIGDSFRVVSGDTVFTRFIDGFGDASVLQDQRAEGNLADRLKSNFDFAKSVGNTKPDVANASNPMTSYFMGAAILAYNAGLYCASNQGNKLCDCKSNDGALSMLNRAISYIKFCPDSPLVLELSSLCAEDQVEAITAVWSSAPVYKQ